ncbi:hypothetical protein M409DRAFT_70154 [Zasmidium cellare ATCC 36951]|uniref:2,3-diketo-5-methylthio-1-phosphopentane phosphatase n=1 Tax=Zasmidium cellare ATCC 36951 TaxID=1080233 RepID=A0A6A6C521_ZASCE|nr:uncharacterized protein M409DRAFT_70154 [Zasmidium cellare ATCC 36951]KAF2160839.1 hypothetical protein M409DRAFT_70154 [Zasmidium cellare ATCC 36951]
MAAEEKEQNGGKKIEGVKLILLDIEGTVCPISYVKDTLFPYATRALPSVLAKQWDSPTFAPYRAAAPEAARASPEAYISAVNDLTAANSKIPWLKNLQGYLWEDGYKTGAYSTPLFADVVPALRRWRDGASRLAIYSSGSVFAQKLLFAHVQTSDGEGGDQQTEDLTGLFEGWFDTTNAGPKTEAKSYEIIAEELKLQPEEILFFSDNVREIEAALKAKMQTVLVDRPGNAPLEEGDVEKYRLVKSFDEVEV